MATRLTLKASTQLVLNPVVHTFLDFLPLGRLEFLDRIQNELDGNPMLESEGSGEEGAVPEPDLNPLKERLEAADPSLLTSWDEDERSFFRRSEDYIDQNRAIELFASDAELLSDHLMRQAEVAFEDSELELARWIIYNLNEEGYLEVELLSVASSLGTSPEEMEAVRQKIMAFDPPGCGAGNLQECLLAQVPADRLLLRRLIAEGLEDLSRSRFAEVQALLGVDETALSDLIHDLRRLNPRPGARFQASDIEPAEVDLMLVREEGGAYAVRFIEDGLPRLTLSAYYSEMLDREGAEVRETRDYLRDRMRNARLFIDALEARKKMIVQIAEYLVRVQKDFLDFGPKWKKPLTMKEVASALGVSESTISRAVNSKYMATERGVLRLKSFFAHGIKGEFGFSHSVETVKDKVRKMIEEEPRESPLSDQDIARRLTDLGVNISRRTVRNYRDELGIAGSSQRKRAYRLQAGQEDPMEVP